VTAFGEWDNTPIHNKKMLLHINDMAITKKKRIIILLLTTGVLAPFLIFCWVNFSENTFLLIILGIIFVGMILEYFGKIYEQKKTTE
jgi:hypothetical protein